jgi:hypothetical protein
MQPNCFSSVEHPPIPGNPKVCEPLFSDSHHHDIDYTPYLNAYLQTVKVGHSPEESLRAYTIAAASRQVATTVGNPSKSMDDLTLMKLQSSQCDIFYCYSVL